MKRRRALQPERDQVPSGFAAPLKVLCRDAPACAAALVDAEGETVDYAGRLDPFQVRVMAAEWRLIASFIESRLTPQIAGLELLVRARWTSFALYGLADGYALVMQLSRGAFRPSHRAVASCIHALCHEAGWMPPPRYARETWIPVQVREGDGAEGRRPVALQLGPRWCAVEVLGRYASCHVGKREAAYRVRLGTGLEATLVREPLGRWYADHALRPH